MIIELLVNLRMDSGSVMLAGRYDSSKTEFPTELWREVEIHKNTGRRTLRIIQDDSPAQTKNVTDIATTIDDESRFVTTDEEPKAETTETKPKKKSRRKRSS